MFVDKTGPREHFFCLLCGHRIELKVDVIMPKTFRGNREISVSIQEFPGGGKAGKGSGFKWSRRPLTRRELLALDEVVAEIAERVREKLDESGGR